MSAWFIAGTDTEIGKTHAACALMSALKSADQANASACEHKGGQHGLRKLAAMKPIAAGIDAGGYNDDVERLRAVANVEIPRDWMTPYLFQPAIAPHLAAQEAGVEINIPSIVSAFRQIETRADDIVVEGVGGFRVPLNDTEDTADLAVALGLPVILVVGLRLGCLSHALLSAEAIESRGLKLAGWIGNHIDPAMARQAANILAIKKRFNAPCLGLLPFDLTVDVEQAGRHLRSSLSQLP